MENKILGNLHWLGHATFRLDGEKVIYFDPYKLPKAEPKADIIFITHEHFDHYSLEDVKVIASPHTVIIADKAVARHLKKAQLSCKEIKALSPGERVEVSSIKIDAVPSYNIDKHYHPRDTEKLGFIVDISGTKIYHAGDTDLIPEMKGFQCDIALLPVCGTYMMTAQEAAQAALIIKPKVAIPMHYGNISGSAKDGLRFAELLKGKIDVKILNEES